MAAQLKNLFLVLKDKYKEARAMGPRGFLIFLRGQPQYWLRIMRHTWRLFQDNRGPYQANTLAYRTMVSLVPMLAFAIAFGAMMGLDIKMKEFLMEMLSRYVPPELLVLNDIGGGQLNIMEKMFAFIEDFQKKAAQNAGIGFMVLLMASIFLINAIERTFNNIWHIRRNRPLGSRILSYTAMTVLIPMALGLSIYMTAQVQAEKVAQVFQNGLVTRYVSMLFELSSVLIDFGLPLAVVWVLFVAMYKWLPFTKVETKAALITSLVTAVAFEILKWGFSFFAASVVLSRQYWWGSLGVFLVFLVWIYLIWWIVLFGAQLLYVYQNYRYVFLKGHTIESGVGEAYLSLRIMLMICRRHFVGEPGPSVSEMAEKLEVDVPRIQEVLARLIDGKLVIIGQDPGKRGEEEIYLPGRDTGSITLAEVIRRATNFWEMRPDNDLLEIEDPANKPRGATEGPEIALDRLIVESRCKLDSTLDISFRDILTQNGAQGSP